jgi:hypothetical protein
MPIPLGVLAQAGAGGGGGGGVATNAYVWLASTILSSNQTNIDFSNLSSSYSGTYQHLQIRAVCRSARSAAEDDLRIRIDGDASGLYASHFLKNAESSFGGANATQMVYNGMMIANSQTANSFSTFVIDILDPFEATKNTTIKILGGYTANLASTVMLGSGLYRSTSAMSSFRLYNGFGDFAAGSRFSLYGLKGS